MGKETLGKKKAKGEKDKEGSFEKGSRWYRNFNAAVGGVALLGAGVVGSAVAANALYAYAGFNFVQAGIGEAGRRHGKNKRKKKNESENKPKK